MSIVLTPQDIELFQNSAKRVGEITEQIRIRIAQILKLISRQIGFPFDGHVYVEPETDYTFGFCDVEAFEYPLDSEIYYSAIFTLNKRISDKEAKEKTISLGHLLSKMPFKWLNWSNARLEKEIPKVFKRNIAEDQFQTEKRRTKERVRGVCYHRCLTKAKIVQFLVTEKFRKNLIKKCIEECILFRELRQEGNEWTLANT